MVWHLKDRELEKKLIAIEPRFVERLNNHNWEHSVSIRMYLSLNRVFVLLAIDDLEDIPEYDPGKWNEYPDITPPYDVMMRVERPKNVLEGAYYHKFKEGDNWCFSNGVVMPKAMSDSVIRFRPWED